MIWADMDFDDRMQVIWRGTRDGLLLKQIATEVESTPLVVLRFARSNGLAVRVRTPGRKQIKTRRGRRMLSARNQGEAPLSPIINTSHRSGDSAGERGLDH